MTTPTDKIMALADAYADRAANVGQYEHGGFMRDARAALRAAVEEAVRDAGRYALLRRGQHWSVVDGIGDTLRADALDAAIDAALAAQPEKG